MISLMQLERSKLESTREMMIEEQRELKIKVITNVLSREGLPEEAIRFVLKDMGLEKMVEKRLNFSCTRCGGDVVDLKCERCNVEHCDRCHSENVSDHQCFPEAANEFKLLKNKCKACPVCKMSIEKEEGGCDQMFCVVCKTTFSWITGRVLKDTEVHHNPHFYEWRRRENPEERNLLDNPNEGKFLMACDEMETKDGELLKFIQNSIMRSIHVFLKMEDDDEYVRERYRVNHILGLLSSSRWKSKFETHVKSLRRNRDIMMVLLDCLDSLYEKVLIYGFQEMIIKSIFMCANDDIAAIQEKYKKVTKYQITLGNTILPYARAAIAI